MSQASASGRWQFWIDRGGTFTDIVALRPGGGIETLKLLSDDPGRYADAALAGIRRLLGTAPEAPIPVERIESVKMGPTVATNALLERKGEPTALCITRGFGDALRIAYQNRPRLFDRQIVLPEMLYSKVIEVEERIGARGEVLARIMLGMKRILARVGGRQVLVFDEVDSGIGGAVAEVVGRKLRDLSRQHQVVCVTHLPQIASFADTHHSVRKEVKGGRTVTQVDRLEKAAVVDEIARMMGGVTVTEKTRAHAKEMIDNAKKS